MMDWAMSRPAFKTQLFRFVDVFPALDGNDDIARHLVEYFDGEVEPLDETFSEVLHRLLAEQRGYKEELLGGA